MIKRWSKFNESNSSDNFRDEVNKIRQYFLEYEDENIVSYEIYACGIKLNRPTQMLWSINPNSDDFKRWLDNQVEESERYMSNPQYRKLFLNVDNYEFFFSANIKITANESLIDDTGVEKLEDVLATCKRLKDEYNKVLIDLNGQHQEYKPVSLRVYFNPVVD